MNLAGRGWAGRSSHRRRRRSQASARAPSSQSDCEALGEAAHRVDRLHNHALLPGRSSRQRGHSRHVPRTARSIPTVMAIVEASPSPFARPPLLPPPFLGIGCSIRSGLSSRSACCSAVDFSSAPCLCPARVASRAPALFAPLPRRASARPDQVKEASMIFRCSRSSSVKVARRRRGDRSRRRPSHARTAAAGGDS